MVLGSTLSSYARFLKTTMDSAKYEAKKALLKRIKCEWGVRMALAASSNLNTSLTWAQAVEGYILARDRLRYYIETSVAFHENNRVRFSSNALRKEMNEIFNSRDLLPKSENALFLSYYSCWGTAKHRDILNQTCAFLAVRSRPVLTIDDVLPEEGQKVTLAFNNTQAPVWWLSFADPNKPKGAQFLGCVLVHGNTFIEAHMNVNFLKLNPGGECQGVQIPSLLSDRVEAKWKGRILTKAECEELDRFLGV